MDRVRRTLSVAVSTGRMAAVFLEDNTVVAWRMSQKAAQNTEDGAAILKSWLEDFEPDLTISEDHRASRKGVCAKATLETVERVLEAHDGLHVLLPRRQVYQDKYEEANALAKRYPQVRKLLPTKPPIWLPEPRRMSYFEALSFVEQLKA